MGLYLDPPYFMACMRKTIFTWAKLANITTKMYKSVFIYSLLMARLEATAANILHYKFNLRVN